MPSAFAKYQTQAYPFRHHGTLRIQRLVGGTPTDPRVAEGWIKSKLADKDDLLRETVAEIMIERGVDADAASQLASLQGLTGFKRDENGLYIEGRQLKACLKEAACVAMAANKLPARWGKTSKGIKGYVAEHIFVIEDRLHLGVDEPTGVQQRFISSFRGSAIQYEEYVESAQIDFTIESDHEFTGHEWAQLWLTAERQGLGASRSQGFGRFTVESWEPVNTEAIPA